MSIRSLALFALVIAGLLAAPAAAQHDRRHGGGLNPELPVDGKPTTWVRHLLTAINEGTNIDAWETKHAMRCRIEIEYTHDASTDNAPPADDDAERVEGEAKSEGDGAEIVSPGDDDEATDAASEAIRRVIRGEIHHDIPTRRLRFDMEDGYTYLVQPDGEIAIWSRSPDAEPVTREDVSAEAIRGLRELGYLLVFPLRTRDEDAYFGAGLMTRQLGEDLYMGVLIAHPQQKRENTGEDEPEQTDVAASQPIPPDWYRYFVGTREPYRVRAIASLTYPREGRLRELPMPRAVTFEEYEVVEEVALPSVWSLWNYGRRTGLSEKPIGAVRVHGYEFIERDEQAIEPPATALRVK